MVSLIQNIRFDAVSNTFQNLTFYLEQNKLYHKSNLFVTQIICTIKLVCGYNELIKGKGITWTAIYEQRTEDN